MKYALYFTGNSAVVQWQDTDIFGYNEPEPPYARIELNDNNLPVDFDVYTQPSGWWVLDGVLTQTPPPVPLSQIAQQLRGQAAARRFAGVAAGVVLADSTVFAPFDTDMLRISSLALGHAVLGITEVDIELGAVWHHFTALDLEGAYGDLMRRREAFYSAESVHCAAIAALLAANDRPGLEAYDITTGWPA